MADLKFGKALAANPELFQKMAGPGFKLLMSANPKVFEMMATDVFSKFIEEPGLLQKISLDFNKNMMLQEF